jgi:integrase
MPSRAVVKSLPFDQWPTADQLAWTAACHPAQRLKRGGAASHLKSITRCDLARRYGAFLDYVKRSESVDPTVETAAYVRAERVQRYVAELNGRVNSVTAYGMIYKLRRMAQLLVPDRDFIWLTEVEKDLALVMQPRSKLDRLVYSEVLLEAGMSLMEEAESATHRPPLAQARQFRDGLMVALLAVCPIRLKNFAALEINRTFKKIGDFWWIVLPAVETKEGRADERPVPGYLTQWIDRYLRTHRPVLARENDLTAALWLSSNKGGQYTYTAVGRAVSEATLATLGVKVSPHLFRTSAASTAAIHGGCTPHLASALLHHGHPSITEEHYNRASSLSAAQTYTTLVKTLRTP